MQNKVWTYIFEARGSVELPYDATDEEAEAAARKQAIERLQNDKTAVIIWRED